MEIVQLDEKMLEGISIRTTNANEINSETAKIGSLHQRFDKTVTVDYAKGYRVYGVYYNYESDASGEFSILSGTDQISNPTNINLERIKILKGKYMVFKGKGTVPKIVIDTWSKIWSYFNNIDSEYQRAYTTDFEFYKSLTEVEIYIAIK